jgi:Glycosyl transferase family 2
MTDGSGPLVAILLSTFNGEPYLVAQLNSFLTQSHENWRVYWRDDGSTDATTDVWRRFAEGPGAGRCVSVDARGHLGATASFFTLLRAARRESAGYFAFADQDDVWLPEKLTHGIAALAGTPPDRPGLWFCARTLVDAASRPIGTPPVPAPPPDFPAALTQNVAPGCCMIVNRAAADLIEAGPVPEETWHDWWTYLLVAASGGRIIADPARDVLYRQHGRNLIGEAGGVWHRAVAAFRRGPGPFMALFWRHARALEARAERLPEPAQAALATIGRARRGGFLSRLRALRLSGLNRQTWSETLLFRLWFLLG